MKCRGGIHGGSGVYCDCGAVKNPFFASPTQPRPIRDSRRDPVALVIFAFAFVGGSLVGVFVLCFGFLQGWWP